MRAEGIQSGAWCLTHSRAQERRESAVLRSVMSLECRGLEPLDVAGLGGWGREKAKSVHLERLLAMPEDSLKRCGSAASGGT